MPLMTFEDRESLVVARELLERRSLPVRLVEAVGQPLEAGLRALPRRMSSLVHAASRRAVERALGLAVETMGHESGSAAMGLHQALAGMSGAVGGFFGIAALAAELPLSTMIMLRSIAAIARAQGEDLRSPAARLACIEVFALGGHGANRVGNADQTPDRRRAEEAAETGYYAVRMALARELTEAARFVAQRQLTEEGAPALVRLLTQVASRFSVTVSEKVAAQAIPVVGALGGLAVNLIFIRHFQDLAQGHFTIRRLERAYGVEAVRAAYTQLDSAAPALLPSTPAERPPANDPSPCA